MQSRRIYADVNTFLPYVIFKFNTYISINTRRYYTLCPRYDDCIYYYNIIYDMYHMYAYITCEYIIIYDI